MGVGEFHTSGEEGMLFVSLFHKRDKLNSTVLYQIFFGIDVEIHA